MGKPDGYTDGCGDGRKGMDKVVHQYKNNGYNIVLDVRSPYFLPVPHCRPLPGRQYVPRCV